MKHDSTSRTSGQAARIIKKFGGPYKAARACNRTYDAVYKWTQPREKGGRGGVIPIQARMTLERAAREQGIELTDKDWRFD